MRALYCLPLEFVQDLAKLDFAGLAYGELLDARLAPEPSGGPVREIYLVVVRGL